MYSSRWVKTALPFILCRRSRLARITQETS